MIMEHQQHSGPPVARSDFDTAGIVRHALAYAHRHMPIPDVWVPVLWALARYAPAIRIHTGDREMPISVLHRSDWDDRVEVAIFDGDDIPDSLRSYRDPHQQNLSGLTLFDAVPLGVLTDIIDIRGGIMHVDMFGVTIPTPP